MIQTRKVIHPEYYQAPFRTVARPDAGFNPATEKLFLAIHATQTSRKAVRIPGTWVQKHPVWLAWLRQALRRQGYRAQTVRHDKDTYVWIAGMRAQTEQRKGKLKPKA